MDNKGVGTWGNPPSTNISPRSDPKRIIRWDRDQKKEGAGCRVDKQNVKKEVKSVQVTLILELEFFSPKGGGRIKT